MKARQLRKARQEMHGHPTLTSGREHWPKGEDPFTGKPYRAGSRRWSVRSWHRSQWRGR